MFISTKKPHLMWLFLFVLHDASYPLGASHLLDPLDVFHYIDDN